MPMAWGPFPRRVRPLCQAEQHQDHAVDDAGQGAEDDDRPGDDEHLGRHAGDEALWLCQDRHTLFSEKLRQPTFQWAAFASGYCLD